MKLEKPFNPEMLYNHIVHYYIDKKGITKEEANKIAQKVITRELHMPCLFVPFSPQHHRFVFYPDAIFLQVA